MKITIKNRDFSPLNGLESKNKFGMSVNFEYIEPYKEKVSYYLNNDPQSDIVECEILLEKVSDEYIIDELSRLGVDIEFIDVKEINTFKEFDEFLIKEEFSYLGKKDFQTNIWDNLKKEWCEVLFSNDEIEKKYNVKLNILNS